MSKYCLICGSPAAVIAFKNNNLCEECMSYIKKSHFLDEDA
ncbi:MAG: hypothetical protein PHW03_00710 [Eubacteriales bacterium]|nr:hypothetical protein [Eubacteriales bacterium]MDD4389302.1 hypothetical protein [Eubacteriales bacterium]